MAMSSGLRARIARALLLAARVIVVLLHPRVPTAVAATLISIAIFAAGW